MKPRPTRKNKGKDKYSEPDGHPSHTPPSRMSDSHLNSAIYRNDKVIRDWSERIYELSAKIVLRSSENEVDAEVETEWDVARSTFNTACQLRRKLLDERKKRGDRFNARNRQKPSAENQYKPFHREREGVDQR